MKKIIKLFIVVFCLFLVGCKEEEKEPPKEEKVYYNVMIDYRNHKVEEGTTIKDYLYSLYDYEYEEKEGYEFRGWYFDEDLSEKIDDFDIEVSKDIAIYSKYIHEVIKIDHIIKYGSPKDIALSDNFVIISPSYLYGISELDLSGYKKIIVEYDFSEKNYIVINEDENRLPYDGFLVLIKEDSEIYDEFYEAFDLGTTIYLNSYNIDYASYLLFEKEKQEAKSVELTGLACSYATIYDVYADSVLFEKAGDHKAYPAPVTKIITAITALKYCPLLTTHTVGAELSLTYEASSPSVAGLVRGQTWTLWQLLYALMLPSGNDAAYEIGALTIDYLEPDNTYTPREKLDKFASLMNEVARYVGATGSHFMIPDGNTYNDERFTYHYVTSNDMVKFALLGFNCAALAQVVRTASITITIESGQKFTFTNTNGFINPDSGNYYKGAIGMKTGYTGAAGSCLITGFYINGRFIIISCLKASSSSDRNGSTLRMIKAALK